MKYKKDGVIEAAIKDAGAEIINLALRRANTKAHENILDYIPEAQVLFGMTIENEENMITAAKQISDDYHCAVLLKDGYSVNNANDLLYTDGEVVWFEGKRINNPNIHGIGCTLSSAIASNLAKGFPLTEAIQRAKDYISGALATMLDLGESSGPMNHAFDRQGEYAKGATK